jgi:flagellin-like hook-associated protein FlgL
MGEYVYVANDKDDPNSDDDPDDAYGENDGFFYVATENITLGEKDASGAVVKPKELLGKGLEKVPSYSVEQGADWSFSKRYDKGQIVQYNGQYFQSLRDGWNNLSTDPQAQTNNDYVVFPSDENFHDDGILVSNSAWLPVEKPLEHVLKFSVANEETPVVSFPASGAEGGNSAKAEVVVDADGYVAGVRVVDPGRYFFGTSSTGEAVPPSFEYAKVVIPGGEEMDVRILWAQDPTGPFKVAGFDFEGKEMISGAQGGTQQGDSYSFATGTKTFLEHRGDDGSIMDVAYNGSAKNAEYYIGHNSKISSTLDAKNKGTEELGDVVSALVDLREAFRNVEPGGGYTEEVEAASQKLISLEGRVVDKMGELSSKMVRMEVVKSHDEDYFMELNERISRDLDVDLSEAIIRMMRASTAYQAALQVGAQLMNTSLLNYI